ncbi:hypothetical protein B296_00012516 [Ensete ventricosum]|uniref:Uncharacterized protein n=1 Tax=Ensete ventricosum TaxID=4639 RepID=A0A426ZWK8_ENSVE|nr:hypothetical protein B296_00012516 [Ensete ventricosum]
MHPLKFPNSGIRAKVFIRKIDFKLCVMRLYRVESFYVFLLHFRSKGSEEEGRPATASPHAGLATHSQAATKAPYKGEVGCGQGQPEREASGARKGRRLWAEAPPAGAVATRGHGRLRLAARRL